MCLANIKYMLYIIFNPVFLKSLQNVMGSKNTEFD